jgi:hypothetical protein
MDLSKQKKKLDVMCIRLTPYVKGVHWFYINSKVGILKMREKVNNISTEESIL